MIFSTRGSKLKTPICTLGGVTHFSFSEQSRQKYACFLLFCRPLRSTNADKSRRIPMNSLLHFHSARRALSISGARSAADIKHCPAFVRSCLRLNKKSFSCLPIMLFQRPSLQRKRQKSTRIRQTMYQYPKRILSPRVPKQATGHKS